MKIKLLTLSFYVFSILLFAQVPDWQWASQAGDFSADSGLGIAIDDNGNSYVTGSFYYSATFGSYSLSGSGYCDIYIAKMDANGNWLWATKAGGSVEDRGRAIAIDDNGNSYVTGSFRDTATFGSYTITSNGDRDIFVAKMDTNGNWLWATNAGGMEADFGYAISLTDNGTSYVTGGFRNEATFGSYSLTNSGQWDIFVAKMDADGNWLWATQAGGISHEYGEGIAIDENGNSYVTGSFYEAATFGSYSITSNGSYDCDIFVAKIDTDGNWLWATNAGGISQDYGKGIAIDNNGDIFITGIFHLTATFGSFSLTSSGSSDIFVAKVDTNGNWIWTTEAGGISDDIGHGITIDENGNSYVTGYFIETVAFGDYSLTSSGSSDIFIAKVDATGNWLWASQAGGDSHDYGYAIGIDENGNSYLTGSFNNTATFGSFSLTSNGGSDIFVAKVGNDTSVENELIPTKMELSNYPNPFNPQTTIEFSIQNDSKVNLSIYNIKSQIIKTLIDNEYSKGSYSSIWNGVDEQGEAVSSGIYYYKLNVNGNTEAVKKCLLLK